MFSRLRSREKYFPLDKRNFDKGCWSYIYFKQHLTTGFELCQFSSDKLGCLIPTFVGIKQFKIRLMRHLPLTVEIKVKQTMKLSLDVVWLALISAANSRWRVRPFVNVLNPWQLNENNFLSLVQGIRKTFRLSKIAIGTFPIYFHKVEPFALDKNLNL